MQSRQKIHQNRIETMFFVLKKFFKKFWGIFVGLGLAVVYILVKNKKKPDDISSGVRDSGKQLSDDTDVIRQGERDATDAEADRHNEQMDAIKQKYNEAKDKLDADTAAEADRIFQEHGDDPEALAQELFRVTGFTIIVPKD